MLYWGRSKVVRQSVISYAATRTQNGRFDDNNVTRLTESPWWHSSAAPGRTTRTNGPVYVYIPRRR